MLKALRRHDRAPLTLRALPACVLFWVVATAQAATPSLPALTPVAVEVDIGALPASEQATLVPLIRAAREIDALYMRQVWPGTAALMAQRQAVPASTARAELDALNFFKGPWDRAGTAFIAGVPLARPIGDFYPSGTTKHDIDAWLATLPAPERNQALDPFTTIERGSSDRFSVVPYSRHYRDGLVEVASALREAAALSHEETLRKYLTLRAQALLDDDYYSSDVAFVGLKGPIDVVLGPYEVDDDAWFGVKAAFTASIGLVNERATQRMSQIASRLQELEDHLPLSPELRGRKLAAAAPIVVLDAIYHAGLAAAAARVGYGLPNDLRVLNAAGARTGTYSNILKLRYDTTFKPMADAVLTDADRSTLRFEDIRDEVMFVRVFDSLGPQLVTGTKQPITDALREDGRVAGQIRSMLLSLWGHRYLIGHGYLERREATSLYSAFLLPALARARGSLSSCTSCQGSTYVLNHLLEARAISLGTDGRVKIDSGAADADIVRAAGEFIAPMAKGDATAVRSLLQHYAVVTPAVRDLLARLGPTPALQRPIYRTADRLNPPMDSGSAADVLQLRNVEVTFHTAGSVLPNKDLDLMMSLYADDAVLTDTAHGNKVYQGKDQVLTYWRDVGAPFRPENHWLGYTPAFRMRAHSTGDAGTLYFECLWMDADRNVIGAHSFSDMTLARVDGHWLVKTIKVGKVENL